MIITIAGNVTTDPELRFTPAGQALAKFSVAVNKRVKNTQTNEWEDGETTFVNCSAWRDLAENVAESLTKGTRVVVTGDFTSRRYDKDGETRTAWELTVDDVGPSLKFATAKATRRQGGQGQERQQSRPQENRQAADPWSSSQPAADPWGAQTDPWGKAPF